LPGPAEAASILQLPIANALKSRERLCTDDALRAAAELLAEAPAAASRAAEMLARLRRSREELARALEEEASAREALGAAERSALDGHRALRCQLQALSAAVELPRPPAPTPATGPEPAAGLTVLASAMMFAPEAGPRAPEARVGPEALRSEFDDSRRGARAVSSVMRWGTAMLQAQSGAVIEATGAAGAARRWRDADESERADAARRWPAAFAGRDATAAGREGHGHDDDDDDRTVAGVRGPRGGPGAGSQSRDDDGVSAPFAAVLSVATMLGFEDGGGASGEAAARRGKVRGHRGPAAGRPAPVSASPSAWDGPARIPGAAEPADPYAAPALRRSSVWGVPPRVSDRCRQSLSAAAARASRFIAETLDDAGTAIAECAGPLSRNLGNASRAVCSRETAAAARLDELRTATSRWAASPSADAGPVRRGAAELASGSKLFGLALASAETPENDPDAVQANAVAAGDARAGSAPTPARQLAAPAALGSAPAGGSLTSSSMWRRVLLTPAPAPGMGEERPRLRSESAGSASMGDGEADSDSLSERGSEHPEDNFYF